MIGFDFPIKPQWIHGVHTLWQPRQLLSDLLRTAKTQTMRELGGPAARRKTMTVIARYFLRTEGAGQSRRTLEQDVWVAFSLRYPASTMAPAYLIHLIAQNEVALQATRFIIRRHGPGDALTTGELRQHTIGQFGERKVVSNAVSAFLRTLLHFGVLEGGSNPGHYRFLGPLAVPREVFPLIVWTWWQRHFDPQIDLDDFTEDPALAFLQHGGMMDLWSAYQPSLWIVEQRLEGRRATLKYADAAGFEQALLRVT